MHPNTDLIFQFYSAFGKKDFRTMQDAYHPEAEFRDPVFPRLSANEVKAMWQMLVTSAKDLKISCVDAWANDQEGECKWEAWYTFSATGRQVHNIVYASFEFKDGKIYRHDDEFNFWRWSRMALGTPGLLLGWTPVIINKVRRTAGDRLQKFVRESTGTRFAVD